MRLRRNRHRHTWAVLSKQTMPSGIDALNGAPLKGPVGLMLAMSKRDVVVTYQCVDCPEQKVERL